MQHVYDPAVAPDPERWRELSESERIRLVERFHRKAKIQVPGAGAHAAIHAIVETQIVENVPAVVRAMDRLSKQGLSRHDCIHAIGSVLAEQVYEIMASAAGDSAQASNARYMAAVERLDGRQWLESGSE